MADTVTIREMELDDLPRVYALGEELFTADTFPVLYRTWDEYELASLYASDGDYCLVAEREDELVGFVLGTLMFKRGTAWTYGWVLWLGVAKSEARRGLGKKLLAKLTDIFVEEGARILIVDTDPENEPALRFFGREGFKNRREHVYLSKNLASHPVYKKRKERSRAKTGNAKQKPPLRRPVGTDEND